MKKTLVLVTKPLNIAKSNLARKVLDQADHIALIQDGVYNKPGDIQTTELYGMPGGHRAVQETQTEAQPWPGNWSALKTDVSSRGVEVGCKLIDYPDLLDAVERHEKIITL